jgi:3-dehydroquinate dehydratase-2
LPGPPTARAAQCVFPELAAICSNTAANCRQTAFCRADFPSLKLRLAVARILVINGPNLNLLGSREPEQYGHRTLQEIMEDLDRFAGACGHELQHKQDNSEGALVDIVHQAACDNVDYIIINPAGYTHTSVVLRDALLAVKIPFVEVHLSAVHAREAFRQKSYFSDIALGVISGFRGDSYMLALQAIVNRIEP